MRVMSAINRVLSARMSLGLPQPPLGNIGRWSTMFVIATCFKAGLKPGVRAPGDYRPPAGDAGADEMGSNSGEPSRVFPARP